MEYQFIQDSLTQMSIAKFSMEHEVFGYWFTDELGQDIKKIEQLLKFLDDIDDHKQVRQRIIGREYTLLIEPDEVTVKNNRLFATKIDETNDWQEVDINDEYLNESEPELDDFDQSLIATCGLDDFKTALDAWLAFNK